MAPTADPPEPTVSSDTAAPHTAESVPDTAAERGSAEPAAVAVGRRMVSPRLTERGMQGLLAMAFAGLLIFVFTDQSNRISRLEDKVDSRFAAQDEKIDARFTAQDEKIDEINLKLTALIAALNMSSAVDAAVEGQLADAP